MSDPITSNPVTDAEFEAAMALLGPFEPKPLLALAVSGGPDSMALAVLAGRWTTARSGAALCLLVDHGLRSEAAAEVEQAAAALGRIGLQARSLKIAAPAPAAGLPAWAREARYRLLADAATAAGALHLLTGHHLDDQAETVLLNLGRGSGAKGLAAMRPVRWSGGVRLLRPLLDFPKRRLAATAAAAGLPVADDATNRDPALARSRTRQALAAGGPGDPAPGLGRTAARLAQDDAALEAAVAALAARALGLSPLGLIRIDRRALAAAPPAVGLRLLARAAHAAGGKAAPARQARVQAALADIRAGALGRRTLAGAVLRLTEDRLTLWREPGRAPPPVAPAGAYRVPAMWDGRFRLWISGAPGAETRVGPLGYDGLKRLEARALRPRWLAAAPRQALAMTPALWRGHALAAPTAFGAVEAGVSDVWLHAEFWPRRPVAPVVTC